MKAADDPAPEQKPFLAHLEDLRLTIIRCAIALALGMGVAVPLIPSILRILKAPLKAVTDNPDFELRSIGVVDGFTSIMQMSFWTGLVFSTPFLVIFIGAFILPALTRREQGLIYRAAGFAVALFAFGVWLGYTFTLPFALKAMYAMNTWIGVQPEWTLASYVSFSTQLLIAFGLAFELPMVLLALGRLGIVKSAQLRAGRRFAFVGILVLGAALTPPDIFSMLIMSVPLYLLYELCVWIIRSWEKGMTNDKAPMTNASI